MALNFGQSLFPNRPVYTANFDYTDIIRGRAYDNLYASRLSTTQTIYESYTGTSDGSQTINSAGNFICQTFTVGNTGSNADFYVTDVDLYASTPESSSFTAFVGIYATTAGEPTGPALALHHITPDEWGSDAHWHKVSFDNTAKLSASTQYAIVIGILVQSSGSVIWLKDGSSPTYTGGSIGQSSNSGDTWTMDTAGDHLFKLYGHTTNPATLNTEAVASGTKLYMWGKDTERTQMLDIDFDGEVSSNITLQGVAFLKFGTGSTYVHGLAHPHGYFDVTLYHVRAGAETSIGTGTTNSVTGTGTYGAQLNITNAVTFKKGDYVRLSMQGFFGTGYYTTSVDFMIYLDASTLVLSLPFKINIS